MKKTASILFVALLVGTGLWLGSNSPSKENQRVSQDTTPKALDNLEDSGQDQHPSFHSAQEATAFDKKQAEISLDLGLEVSGEPDIGLVEGIRLESFLSRLSYSEQDELLQQMEKKQARALSCLRVAKCRSEANIQKIGTFLSLLSSLRGLEGVSLSPFEKLLFVAAQDQDPSIQRMGINLAVDTFGLERTLNRLAETSSSISAQNFSVLADWAEKTPIRSSQSSSADFFIDQFQKPSIGPMGLISLTRELYRLPGADHAIQGVLESYCSQRSKLLPQDARSLDFSLLISLRRSGGQFSIPSC